MSKARWLLRAFSSGGHRRLTVPIAIWHILSGLFILMEESAAHVTVVSGMHQFLFFSNADALGAFLLFAGLSSIFATWGRFRFGTVFAIAFHFPQLVALTSHGVRSGVAMWQHRFADGVIRPWEFIAVDQMIYPILAIVYIVSMYSSLCVIPKKNI